MRSQRGGFGVGVAVGLLFGLVMAVGVAVYVTKAPTPFVDKVPSRTAEQEAAEAEKNRHWDPNAPLSGKNPARPQPGAAPVAEREASPSNVSSTTEAVNPDTPVRAASAPSARPSSPAAAPSASAKAGADPFVYFVQIGAYINNDEAEQQRANLAMNGLKARITEREQAGRVMYRVRLGPFDTREDAERVRDQTSASGYGEAALVRVPR
jgi:cell division protein FtsN